MMTPLNSRLIRLALAIAASLCLGAIPAEWQDRYNDLCSYEPACSRVDQRLDMDVFKALQKMKPLIQAAAKLYDVDERAIVGSIMAEHSMNTSAKDVAELFLVKTGVTPTGKIFGHTFGYGLGQLHCDRAEEVEAMDARIEGRPKRDQNQVCQAISRPEGAIFYVAGLLRQAQDAYKSAGYDIKNDLGVLTTLYNIGRIEDRLKRTQKEGRIPKPNYFGFFVLMHEKEITEAFPKKAAIASSVPAKAPSVDKKQASAPKGDTVKMYIAKGELKLSQGPIGCFGDHDMVPIETISVKKDASLLALSPDVDCNLEQWLRVQDDRGQIGWIKEQTLHEKTEILEVPKSSCSRTLDQQCRNVLVGLFGANIGQLTAPGILEVSLSKQKERPKQSVAEVESTLRYLKTEISGKDKAVLDILKGYDNATQSDIDEVANAINAFKRKTAQALDLDPWGDDNNPYQQYFDANFRDFSRCQEDRSCVINKKGILKWLAGMKIKKNPTNKDLEPNEADKLGIMVFQTYAGFKHDYLSSYIDYRKKTEEEFFRPMEKCRQAIVHFPKSMEILKDGEAQIMTALSQANAEKDMEKRADKIDHLVNDYGQFWKVCDAFYQEPVARVENGKPKNGSCSICTVSKYESGTRNLMDISQKVFLSSFKNNKEKDEYLAQSFQDLKPGEREDNTFVDIRDLVQRVSAVPCVKTLYVSQPWLASEDKAIYQENNNISSAWVDLTAMACKRDDKEGAK
jgi:hypothetical protein